MAADGRFSKHAAAYYRPGNRLTDSVHFHSRIYFFGVAGHTQLVGCAPPTQTLG